MKIKFFITLKKVTLVLQTFSEYNFIYTYIQMLTRTEKLLKNQLCFYVIFLLFYSFIW